MTNPSPSQKKEIPRPILVVGAFQVAVGLWAIFGMAVPGAWDALTLTLAGLYIALGAGLLAMKEWARFADVVLHAMLVPYLLATVVYEGRSGTGPALQMAAVLAIFFILTRPPIRARFRRSSQSTADQTEASRKN